MTTSNQVNPAYIPGVGNIGRAEIKRWKLIGWIALTVQTPPLQLSWI